MLIQITNTCTFGCPHCLQASGPTPQHMPLGLFKNALILSKMAKCQFLMISGGEPTDHPDWENYLDLACNNADCQVVMFITNGKWLGTDKEDIVLDKLRKHPLLFIQVTSDPRYYPDWSRKTISERFHLFEEKCGDELGMCHVDSLLGSHGFSRVALIREINDLKALGRAAEVKTLRKVARACHSTTSCAASALIAAQAKGDFISTISFLEKTMKWCRPLVDWRGGVHWSESWLCPSFFTIPSHLLLDEPMFLQISEAASAWRPCGKCEDYQKLLTKTDPKYVKAREILGISK